MKNSIWLALTPVFVLIAILAVGVQLFGDELTSGPSQVALITASVAGALIAMFINKLSWEKLEEGILENLSKTGSAIFILLMIGALTASWIQSGVVPTMIYYGLKIINPDLFLIITFVFTGAISLVVGSSWTTIGTIGVAMLSVGQILGVSEGWLAGAIISGAYLGDKLSPLSDTTNLAATISEVPLYGHIKYLVITNIPIFIISAIVFTIAGFYSPIASDLNVEQQITQIASTYNVSAWLLLIPCITIYMIYKKVSPYLTLFLSAIIGSIVTVIAQPEIVAQISSFPLEDWRTYIYTPLKLLSSKVDIVAGNQVLDGLVSTKGMSGMLNTVWLILCVVAFGGVMEAAGFVNTITSQFMKFVKKPVSLVTTTVGTGIVCNIILSDQYMSIIISGKMFANIYKEKDVKPELLSRTIEDSATVTSVLVPWNSCAVVQSGVLGIPTLTYLPYCILNIISPIITIIVAATGYKIAKEGKKIKEKFN